MKDIFKRYKHNRIKKHAGIITLSAIFALWINSLLFSPIGGNALTANILSNSESTQTLTNTKLIVESGELMLLSQSTMQDVESISFTIAYDPSSIEFTHQESYSIIENVPGLRLYTIQMQGQDIMPWDVIALMPLESDSTGIINIVQTQFTDTLWESYEFSAENVIF